MAKRTGWRGLLDAVIACSLLAAVTFWLTGWLLGEPRRELAPVAFGPEITAEPDSRVADVRAAAQFARERWSYTEHRRRLSAVDLDQLEIEALAMLGEVSNDSTFRDAITRFVAGLCDGHAWVRFDGPRREMQFRWPFALVEVAEGFFVDAVLDGVEGIERGDLLLEVDARPVDDWVAEAQPLVFASTPRARRYRALERAVRYGEAARRRFRIVRRDGSEASLELDCPPYYVSIESPSRLARTREHRLLDGGIGYFRPGSFSAPRGSGWADAPPEDRDAILASTYAEFDKILATFRDAPALILDLRNNPGGTDMLGQFLVDRLVEPGFVYFALSSLGPGGWSEFMASGSDAPPGDVALRMPLVCLIDEKTFSTADNVAACLADVHPNVKFVGRPNGAGTGAPRSFVLPRTGTTIYFCTHRVQTPSGRMGEGISVELDVPVEWTRADLLEGRDPDLAAALELLRR